jgi:transcriptional regulator with XRE-family HTH domain
MPKVTFAVRLQRAIVAAGLTPYALAKRAQLSKQAVSNLLAGERQPNWDTVQRLAAALGLDCRAFADPDITAEVAAAPPAKPRGRPRSEAGEQTPAKPPTKKAKG